MKPKIGIMTYYAVQNYGAALQAFALQQSLKKLGGEPEFIRYFDKHNEGRPSKRKQGVFNILKNKTFRNELFFHFRRFMRVRRQTVNNSVAFSSFRNKYLKISREPYYDWEDLQRANGLYNGFVVGSDMVWTPIGQDLDAYFLQFANEGKKYSYAASMTGCTGYTKEETSKMASYIPTFTRISCREKEGVDFAKKISSKDVELVCDPTLLLDKEEWKKELTLKEKSDGRPYVLCYMFGGIPRDAISNVQRIAKENGMMVRYVPSLPQELDAELSLGHPGPCGPREFAELFLNASFVVTNSYHGFLFSLINEKPFLVYHRDKKNKWKANETRISDLLELLGIAGRYVDNNKQITQGDLSLDYSVIRENIKGIRESSLAYLQKVVSDIAEQPFQEFKYDYPHIGRLSRKQCTGCGVCEQICPFQAIKMIE